MEVSLVEESVSRIGIHLNCGKSEKRIFMVFHTHKGGGIMTAWMCLEMCV